MFRIRYNNSCIILENPEKMTFALYYGIMNHQQVVYCKCQIFNSMQLLVTDFIDSKAK